MREMRRPLLRHKAVGMYPKEGDRTLQDLSLCVDSGYQKGGIDGQIPEELQSNRTASS